MTIIANGMDFAAEIAALEIELQKEIAERRFDKVAELQVHITTLRDNSSVLSVASSPQWKFESAKQDSVADLMLTSSALTRKISSIRATHQSTLAQMRRIQAEELFALSSALAKELELVATRSIPQANALFRLAQRNAQMGRYNDAQAIADDAKRLREDIIAERQAQLHEQHSARQENLRAKQIAVDRQICAKLAADIQNVRIEYATALALHRQRILASAAKCGATITDAEIDQLFTNCVLWDESTTSQEQAPSRLDPPPARATRKSRMQ
jgi:hypothetical protein